MNLAAELFLTAFSVIMSFVIVAVIIAKITSSAKGEE